MLKKQLPWLWVMLCFSSKEGLIKGVSLSTNMIGNVRCRITGIPEETTYDVIHGISVKEDLAFLQETLEYDRSKWAALIRVERLKNKRGAPSTAIKLTFSGTCPLRVFIHDEGAAPHEVLPLPGIWPHVEVLQG